jgi:hypothetical protein
LDLCEMGRFAPTNDKAEGLKRLHGQVKDFIRKVQS